MIYRKGRFKAWNEREKVGNGKLLTISMTVSSINGHIRFYS